MKPRFLNIDLELITEDEPKYLIRDFGDRVSIMHSGQIDEGHLLTLEIAEWFDSEILILQKYDQIFRALSPEGKKEWDNAGKKEFNFGYETEVTPQRVEVSLSEEALSLLTKINCSFGVTIYHNGKTAEPAG